MERETDLEQRERMDKEKDEDRRARMERLDPNFVAAEEAEEKPESESE